MAFLFLSLGSHTHTHFRLNGNFFWYGVKKWKDAHHFLFSSVSSLTVNADGYDAVSLEERIFPVLSCYGKITKNKRPISLTDGHRQTTRARRNETSETKKMFDARTSSELFDQESLDRVTSFSAVAPIGEAGVWIPVHIAVRIYFYIYRPSEISKTVLPKEWYFTHRQLIEFVSVQRFFFLRLFDRMGLNWLEQSRDPSSEKKNKDSASAIERNRN